MRKQTKLVAVLSAAALLAIGASMTSFAKGWTEENGEWVYLDNYDDRVTQEWKKSGGNYYYLNDEGVMATNTLVEYKDDIYYVNENGVKVMNNWVSVENEDDVDVDGKEVDVLWYYFGSAGKAVKATSGDLKVKTCDYAGGSGTFVFDADGHMVSGWTEVATDDGYNLYYLGDENQGWAHTGWQYLEPSEKMDNDDYDDEMYFYFQSSGKAYKAAAGKNVTKYIDGRYYTFDENGAMVDGWFDAATPPAASPSTASIADAYADPNGVMKSGWVWTTARDDDDGDEAWFYLVSIRDNNKVSRSVAFNSNLNDGKWRAKVIKGKTYLFDTDGEMLTGVKEITAANTAQTNNGFYGIEDRVLKPGIYYFTKGDYTATAGQMVTGKAAVTDDGETYYYHFDKTTGKAYTAGVKDSILYGEDGKRIAADDGNANMVYTLDFDAELYGSSVDAASNGTIPAGKEVIVSSSGKIRKSGSVKIDGVRYTVENYIVTDSVVVD